MAQPHPLSAADWMTFIASFVVLAALLAAAYWLLLRTRAAVGRRGAGKRIEILESAMLGPRQRLLLVRAIDKEVLIGVSGQSLTPLVTWDAAALASRQSSSPGGSDVAAPLSMSGRSFKRIFERIQFAKDRAS